MTIGDPGPPTSRNASPRGNGVEAQNQISNFGKSSTGTSAEKFSHIGQARSREQKHLEARRLLELGYKLVELKPLKKQPVGNSWQRNPVTRIDDNAGGYGVLLTANRLCSIDPDDLEAARGGLKRCGFDLEELLEAGVRTCSTRPGSGGRGTFRASDDLSWITFRSKRLGTILELRAKSSNLQDCLPGTRYCSKDGREIYEQSYANGKKLEEAPGLPPEFLSWWIRLSTDLEFLRAQQSILCGADAQLAVSAGIGKKLTLAYGSSLRREYNATHDVEELLARHGYTQDGQRLSPPTASGAPGVRAIPGRDGLWQSDHASDPMFGTFDAWAAFVQLEHGGDVSQAERAFTPERDANVAAGFEEQATIDSLGNRAARFTVISAADFVKQPSPGWIVHGVLPRAEVAVLFGESQSGKSFAALDLAVAVAMGTLWRGRRVTRGRVVYIAAEGMGGCRNRLKAIAIHRGVDLRCLDLIADCPNFLQKDDALAVAKSVGKADVIIVDTFAQVTPGGNENSAEDVGKALAHCKEIHRITGALVILIHHSGKDSSKGARGWSGLRAAADAEIEITRSDGVRTMRVTKQKDGEDGLRFPFKLEVVEVGRDEHGDPVTSCVVVHSEMANHLPLAAPRKLGTNEAIVLEEMERLVDASGSVLARSVYESAAARVAHDPEKKNKRRSVIKRAIATLQEKSLIVVEGDFLKLPRPQEFTAGAHVDRSDPGVTVHTTSHHPIGV